MKPARILWVDNLKFLCIQMVILSHLNCCPALLDKMYLPVFLTGFLFAAGYVYQPRQSFSGLLKKKIRCLLWPWLVFSVGNLLLSRILSFQVHDSLGRELLDNFLQIRGQGDGLWFVAALFVAFVPFYGLIRCCPPNRLWVLVPLLLAADRAYTAIMDPAWLPWNSLALPWHLEYIPYALSFMILGYLFRHQWEQQFDWYFRGAAGWALVLLYGLAVLLVPESWQLLLSFPGLSALVVCCKAMPENRLVSYIGANTLICFGLHGKIISVLEWTLARFQPAFREKTGLLPALVLTAAVSLLLLIPIYGINRWFPVLLGRRKKEGA